MKKLLLIFAILLLPLTSAISTDMKAIYQPGETLIAEISGNILSPIKIENIELKRGHVQVPWQYDTKRIREKYFIYGLLPYTENNYTLFIKNIATTVNGIVTEIDFNQSFMTTGEVIPYSIEPGFAILKEEVEFNIFLNKDSQETITIDFPEPYQIILNPGENTIKLANFSVEPGFRKINMGMYSVPVFITGESDKKGVQILFPEIRIFPTALDSILLFDEIKTYPFKIINVGEKGVSDLYFDYNQEIFMIEPDPIKLKFIAPNETLNLNLSLKKYNEPIQEVIKLKAGNALIEFPVNIDYTEEQSKTETPYLKEDISKVVGYYCEELDGTSCTADEVCDGEIVSTLDISNCCVGSCANAESESEGSNLSWIGWLLGAIVFIVIIIIARRYFKTRKNKENPLERRLTEVEKK